jgi:ABC-type siderophore export system fused ATPase/permease subunit
MQQHNRLIPHSTFVFEVLLFLFFVSRSISNHHLRFLNHKILFNSIAKTFSRILSSFASNFAAIGQ